MDICRHEDTDIAGRFAVLLWALWSNRNSSVWTEKKETGRAVGVKAQHLWTEWKIVQQNQHNHRLGEQQQQELMWQKPSFGWYKCNVDAGFHGESNKTSAGWCLRDHSGLFVMAGTSWSQGKCSIIEGESMALLD
ncbi:cytochrome P450 [Trifolium medium]|uniref:Cytochrome P450 n=1 Tax=Trifolium medium TaxID=97028 RepID=A0A392P2D3_9FABA|nr:cytochrome P450 [Trifolium medium]